MKQVVYVDILLALNLFVNYFLLLSTAKFLSLSIKRRRLLFGAALGSFYSLSLFLPEMPAIFSLLLKLALSVTIVLSAFGWRPLGLFCKLVGVFYSMNFAYAGFMLVLWYFVSPQGLLIKNSIVYMDISPIVLIVFTVLAYLVIEGVTRLTGRRAPREISCRIEFEAGGKIISCTARVDTGNSLVEPFSGCPVVVVERDVLGRAAPAETAAARLVPFSSVAGRGLLPAFKPDKMSIHCTGEKPLFVNTYLAVYDGKLSSGEFSALLNPALLS